MEFTIVKYLSSNYKRFNEYPIQVIVEFLVILVLYRVNDV